jgi:hypothetical protein
VKEIVLVSSGDGSDVEPFARRLATSFVPRHVLVVVTGGAASAELARLVPLVAEKTARDGRPTAYVCENRVCKLPATDVETFAAQLGAPGPIAHPPRHSLQRQAGRRLASRVCSHAAAGGQSSVRSGLYWSRVT